MLYNVTPVGNNTIIDVELHQRCKRFVEKLKNKPLRARGTQLIRLASNCMLAFRTSGTVRHRILCYKPLTPLGLFLFEYAFKLQKHNTLIYQLCIGFDLAISL